MAELDLAELTAASLERIRERTPLVHNITNFVVMNDTANVLLAIGASPVMAHAIERSSRDGRATPGRSSSTSAPWRTTGSSRCSPPARRRTPAGVPVVLDPVGAGATALRTTTVRADPGHRPSGVGPRQCRGAGDDRRPGAPRSAASIPSPPTRRMRPPGWSRAGPAARPWPVARSTSWPTPRAWPRSATATRSWAASPAPVAWPRRWSGPSWRWSPIRSWRASRR